MLRIVTHHTPTWPLVILVSFNEHLLLFIQARLFFVSLEESKRLNQFNLLKTD